MNKILNCNKHGNVSTHAACEHIVNCYPDRVILLSCQKRHQIVVMCTECVKTERILKALPICENCYVDILHIYFPLHDLVGGSLCFEVEEDLIADLQFRLGFPEDMLTKLIDEEWGGNGWKA